MRPRVTRSSRIHSARDQAGAVQDASAFKPDGARPAVHGGPQPDPLLGKVRGVVMHHTVAPGACWQRSGAGCHGEGQCHTGRRRRTSRPQLVERRVRAALKRIRAGEVHPQQALVAVVNSLADELTDQQVWCSSALRDFYFKRVPTDLHRKLAPVDSFRLLCRAVSRACGVLWRQAGQGNTQRRQGPAASLPCGCQGRLQRTRLARADHHAHKRGRAAH
jgi:hypothetical protein